MTTKDLSVVASQSSPSLRSVFERLATDPAATVDTLERLMLMHERISLRDAEQEFNSALSDAQSEMVPVGKDMSNPQTRSRYASYEAIDSALRPIYTRYGFGISYDTADCPREGWMRVIALVTHRGGFKREYHIDLPADGKGAKGGDVMTGTHAVGAGTAYGMRYLLKMIWNVAVGEFDRDGNAPPSKPAKPAPAGFDNWLVDLELTSKDGMQKLKTAWNASLPERRDYLVATNAHKWEDMKKRAAAVKA